MLLSFVSEASKLCTTTESLKDFFSVVDAFIDYTDAERRYVTSAVELSYTVIQYNYTIIVDEPPPKAAVSARSISCLLILPRFGGCILHSKSQHLRDFQKQFVLHSAKSLIECTCLLCHSS